MKMEWKALRNLHEWWALLFVLLTIAIFLIVYGVILNYKYCGSWWC